MDDLEVPGLATFERDDPPPTDRHLRAPGSGKSTVGRLLAKSFERAAYIEADVLQHFVVAGLELANH